MYVHVHMNIWYQLARACGVSMHVYTHVVYVYAYVYIRMQFMCVHIASLVSNKDQRTRPACMLQSRDIKRPVVTRDVPSHSSEGQVSWACALLSCEITGWIHDCLSCFTRRYWHYWRRYCDSHNDCCLILLSALWFLSWICIGTLPLNRTGCATCAWRSLISCMGVSWTLKVVGMAQQPKYAFCWNALQIQYKIWKHTQ